MPCKTLHSIFFERDKFILLKRGQLPSNDYFVEISWPLSVGIAVILGCVCGLSLWLLRLTLFVFSFGRASRDIQHPVLFAFCGLLCRLIFLKVVRQEILWILAQMRCYVHISIPATRPLKVYMKRNFLLAYTKELSKWWKMAFILL